MRIDKRHSGLTFLIKYYVKCNVIVHVAGKTWWSSWCRQHHHSSDWRRVDRPRWNHQSCQQGQVCVLLFKEYISNFVFDKFTEWWTPLGEGKVCCPNQTILTKALPIISPKMLKVNKNLPFIISKVQDQYLQLKCMDSDAYCAHGKQHV